MLGAHGMGGGAAAPPQPKTDSHSIYDITSLIEDAKSEIQNATSDSVLSSILKGQGGYKVTSDCDAQLLFNLYFSTPVKIHHLKIRGCSLGTSPLNIKLFINRAPLSFDDVEAIDPTEELEIQEGELEGDLILSYVKYQNVSNLTIFVEDNREGGDVTEMSQLEFFGAPLHETNMSELKKVG